MSTRNTNDPQHWRDRAAQMRSVPVKMAGSEAAILINDLAVHYDELDDQAALKESAFGAMGQQTSSASGHLRKGDGRQKAMR
jgi:hypothetical protein